MNHLPSTPTGWDQRLLSLLDDRNSFGYGFLMAFGCAGGAFSILLPTMAVMEMLRFHTFHLNSLIGTSWIGFGLTHWAITLPCGLWFLKHHGRSVFRGFMWGGVVMSLGDLALLLYLPTFL